jgi:hypothetical protein
MTIQQKYVLKGQQGGQQLPAGLGALAAWRGGYRPGMIWLGRYLSGISGPSCIKAWGGTEVPDLRQEELAERGRTHAAAAVRGWHGLPAPPSEQQERAHECSFLSLVGAAAGTHLAL